ncbi:TorF family putative porin [Parvularcula dongshanensis]|uniref:Uncharacterized protein (TIGR02001 family) n=1 Tax=Parvularcula dongshanensis TaxID=1173995 RepID=A0A840I3W5_9PROT|nr:TorF family putative porin [Parvularcula dongshanensis]MBB4658868.1 uncharacterized protein (TIGR02001 family) [Parvularcula dongshanensis]
MKIKLALLAAAATLSGSAALAQEAPWGISANVAYTSDYRFRGVSYSNGGLAIQGGFDLTHENGLYVGTWMSSIDAYLPAIVVGADGSAEIDQSSETELDLYGGYAFDVGSAAIDVGVLYYQYPGASNDDYVELYGSVAGDAGVVSLTAGAAYVPDQDNAGGDNLYLYGSGSVPLGDSPFEAFAQIGYTDGSFVFSGSDQFDWQLGVSTAFAGLDVSVAYVDTDADTDFGDSGLPAERIDVLEDRAKDIYGATVVLTVGKTF